MSDEVIPPPAASPRPPDPGEPVDTGVYPASRDFVREVNRVGLWRTSWAIIVAGLAIITSTLWAYRAVAAEARDAGAGAAADVKRQAEATQRELERYQRETTARLERMEANQNADRQLSLGTSQKVDKLLERFNVPNPAPTPPPDGGPK